MTAWLVLVQLPLWMTVIGTLTSLALLWWAFRADAQPAAKKTGAASRVEDGGAKACSADKSKQQAK